MVLVIHGGPEAATTERFSPLTQLLAAAGFLVFEPNYRGSTNLGDDYQHAIFRDTGDGPGKDVMAGLAAVEKRGIVDTDRIGVSGWSYGGYMTDMAQRSLPGMESRGVGRGAHRLDDGLHRLLLSGRRHLFLRRLAVDGAVRENLA